jgi:hypothetical protein
MSSMNCYDFDELMRIIYNILISKYIRRIKISIKTHQPEMCDAAADAN